ncbi:MAG: hypothetical protein B7Z22_13095 [Hyphomonas sp. 32-62-5]|nr:MAG: hypothetical protein B7Z22_13095 [Hyphomonas sp. 32-62-5]
MLHVAALSGLSEAEVAAGLNGEAAAEKAVSLAGENPAAQAMAHIAYGRALAHVGKADQAREALARAEAALPALGPAGARLKQTLDSVRETYAL